VQHGRQSSRVVAQGCNPKVNNVIVPPVKLHVELEVLTVDLRFATQCFDADDAIMQVPSYHEKDGKALLILTWRGERCASGRCYHYFCFLLPTFRFLRAGTPFLKTMSREFFGN
jgi:hypothetical protein